MMEHKFVQRDQIEEALEVHGRLGESRLLGRILVGRGYATPPQVQLACDCLAQEMGPVEQLV
jgi:hypothetical protein